MGWVVLGHTYLYMNSMAGGGVANQAFDETIQARLATILISNGQFSVDTFFVLSGFLGAYVGLRKLAAMDRVRKKRVFLTPVPMIEPIVLTKTGSGETQETF
jgi:peptidoglycan/LPS O-acetylase OafA/YrhL